MRSVYRPAKTRKYILSVITLAIVASALIVGSVGSLIQVASARENSRRNSGYSYQQRSNNNSNNSRQSDSRQSQQNGPSSRTNQPTQNQSKQVAPAKTTEPAKPVTPPAQSAAPAVVVQRPATPPPPPDTAPEITQMSEAQAVSTDESVSYGTARISEETRNRILMLAGVAAVTGALLYTMSYVTVGALTGRRPVPVRYIVPVNGVTRS